MTKLILDLLKNCIEGGMDLANGFSLSFISLVFQFEETFWDSIGMKNPVDMSKLFASILTISLSLITMKSLLHTSVVMREIAHLPLRSLC